MEQVQKPVNSSLVQHYQAINDAACTFAGVLPTKSVPDQVLTWPSEPGLQGLVWNMSTMFEITSTVFYSPITPNKRAKTAFLFHHGKIVSP